MALRTRGWPRSSPPRADILRERCLATAMPVALPLLDEDLDAGADGAGMEPASGAQPDDGPADPSSSGDSSSDGGSSSTVSSSGSSTSSCSSSAASVSTSGSD